ncbi:MAG: hypothetical protein AB7F65_05365 [Dehalococcoidia bacterium]
MGGVRQFLVTPLGRAALVALGFLIFLVTYVFWTSGPGLWLGFGIGLAVMVIPFGFGRDAAARSEGGPRNRPTDEPGRRGRPR